MSEKKIKEAVNYGQSSNGLENNMLTTEEIASIIDALAKERSDRSLLESIIMKFDNRVIEDIDNDKTRR